MIRLTITLLLLFFTLSAFPQQGQLSVPRIDRMPDLPAPLVIRDWKAVARNYDSLVFDRNKTGSYLPLSKLGAPGQFQYADNTPLFMDSYVGADDHLKQAEAINIMPAIVGASLSGIDKSNQNGMNFVSMTKDFFNLKNRQNVYLNGYSTTSGNDWWYDVMPNVYFYQLRALYPDVTPEHESQFISVADQWLYCVNRLGGSATPWAIPNMNYRAFNLITGLPLNTSVPEPESAGSIAWLLYNAYLETGNKKYFSGAQMAMDFLTRLQSNPSYELQLSYGTLAAARMNAAEGTNYPVQKLLDWCFNRGDLRGWGSIIGKWGDYDVSGLIGEANDEGDDYAFVMNGFQQAAALAPLPKYDKRYARALAKWILNVTNASRLFYRNALPESLQDSYTWSSEYDPKACIPHESMKEIKQGKSPYATGDAIGGGWASTNLSLYSGSSVGYLAGVVDTTNISGILRIDLNKTDFYGDNSLISYLYFNPLTETKQVIMDLTSEASGIYDAITETVLTVSASGSFQLNIPPGEVRLIRLYAAASVPEARNGRLYAGNAVLDYHYQYDFSADLRIKSLVTDRNPIAKNTLFTAYCEPENIPSGETVQFEWFLDEALLSGKNQTTVQLTAPTLPGQAVLRCRISAGDLVAEDTIHLQIVDRIAVPPVVNGIQPAFKFTVTGGTNTFTAIAEPAPDEILEFEWSATSGSFSQSSGNSATWQAPATPGVNTITVKVTNQDQLFTAVSVDALVKDTSLTVQSPLIWYPFDINDNNAAADRFHATASGVTKTQDARGNASMAYQFSSGQDIIYTENADDLNFSNAISLSCWVKCGQLGSERFIISHGSWQQRYKLSITPEGFLRWTVKTNTGVADLDGSFPIELNRYYHVAALFTGYSMELYVDGILDTCKAFSGTIQPSTKPITIGRMDNTETLYSLRGSVDEVKLWDREIPLKQIERLKDQWYPVVQDTTGDPVSRLYPNPVHEVLNIGFTNAIEIESITLFDSEGRKVFENLPSARLSEFRIDIPKTYSGVYVLRIFFKDGRVTKRKIVVAD